MQVIHIGSDHAGYLLKEFLKEVLVNQSLQVQDYGTFNESSTHYPSYAQDVAKAVQKNNSRGVLICGSGIGMSISANRFKQVRAALCWSKEIATLSRQHNNSNVLVLPARFLTNSEAKEILITWLNTNFEGGRHAERIELIESGC